MVKSDLVRQMNEDYARLRLEAARIEELPIELEQLRKAMEAANPRVDFDTDPLRLPRRPAGAYHRPEQ